MIFRRVVPGFFMAYLVSTYFYCQPPLPFPLLLSPPLHICGLLFNLCCFFYAYCTSVFQLFLSLSGCLVVHFCFRDQLLICLDPFLSSFKTSCSQIMLARKIKSFQVGLLHFPEHNLFWRSSSAILGTKNGQVFQKSYFYCSRLLRTCSNAVRLHNAMDNYHVY